MSASSGVHTNGIESNAGCDGLALHALLQRRFKGALFFGGHSQFLGNWSLFLSLGPSRTPRPNQLCPSSPRPPPMLLTPSGRFCATPFLTGVCVHVCVRINPQQATHWESTQHWPSNRRPKSSAFANTTIATRPITGKLCSQALL